MKKTLTSIVSAVLLSLGAASAAENPYLFRILDAGNSLPENNVRAMLMLPDGLMCIQTASYLCFFDGASCTSYRWDPVMVPYSEFSAQSGLRYDAESDMIVLRTRDRVWAFDMAARHFVYETDFSFGDVSEPSDKLDAGAGAASRTDTAVSSDGRRWFLSDKHIVGYNPRNGKVSELEAIPQGSDDLFTCVAVDMDDNLWVGTARSGVRIRYKDGTTYQFPYLETIGGRRIYPHTDISRIYADPKGGIWVATQSEGLLYWYKDILRFKTVNSHTLSGGSMPDESVKCLSESPDGKVLVGTVRGLLMYDPERNSMSLPYRELRDELIISLFVDGKGRIWAGTFYNGLYCIDNGRVRHYSWDGEGSVELSYLNNTPNRNNVRSLMEDREGRFWISVYGGVGFFDPEDGSIRLLRDAHPELGGFMMVRSVSEGADGTIEAWGDNGGFVYSPQADSVLSSTPVNPMQTDEAKLMSSITDDTGALWYATSSTITRSRKAGEDEVLTTYGEEDGVSCGAFFENSVLKHSDGKLYFGGSSGFCIVDPARASLREYGVPPMISTLTVGGEPSIFPRNGILKLGHDETDISIFFTNLNYANPGLSVYRYRLEGFEKEWHVISSRPQGSAVYTYLEPGKYTFEVEASNNGTEWSEPTTLGIEVKPAFYASTAARILYVILAVLAVLGLFWALSLRDRRRMEQRMESEQRKQEEELNQMKFRFFTNISHELRTPLSLIILPLESLMKDKEGTDEYPKLETMHRNTKELLTLVNHLLDFRKLETGGEKPQMRSGNFSDFVINVTEAFRDVALKKNIRLEVIDDTDNPMMSFDSTMMQKVINNLLSNAMKFTPEGGYVGVRLLNAPGGRIRLEVADTGIGISTRDLDHVFDRFYRGGNVSSVTGSGIGLSLVKQYTELHGGEVSVSSEEGRGTTFTLLLPVMHASAQPAQGLAEQEGEETPEEQPVPEADSRRRIMIVDDNSDFRRYLCDELQDEYIVSDASDGEDCLRKLQQVQPDIVVSDVMMPGMNGFELTRRIKEDIGTSHIPVILLSARMSEDVRTEGYEYGADAYLTKPFRMEMLKARIKNLLEEREKRIRSFSSAAEVSPMHVTITTVDQKLMARITDKLEANMDNAEYSVEQLASEVGMHRMNLYRKIQSLFGMTPSEFIRTMRLKRAAQILGDDPNISVVEVAEMVGFNTPKYFTRYFKEMFGVLPSQYKKQ